MSIAIPVEKLDFWLKHNQNVLLIGKHGCGKTSIVTQTFDRNNINYRYFSAATMDPWVDFIGVPRENHDKLAESFEIVKQLAEFDEKLALQWLLVNWKMEEEYCLKILSHVKRLSNRQSYLELIRPADFANDEVEAIFFDEFNRAPKKVRNAVMELMQFKSINGRKFNNLRVIWAAVNPKNEDDTYDVEDLDPAQLDRFQIKKDVPYEPDMSWFSSQYGEQTAKIAISWWKKLPDEIKDMVSPRRLDYALNLRKVEGDIGDMRDILPLESNVGELIAALRTGHVPDKLAEFLRNNDAVGARSFLSIHNQYKQAIQYIPSSEKMMSFFLPLCNKENLASLMVEQESCSKFIINKSAEIQLFKDVCNQIIDAGLNTELIRKIRKAITQQKAQEDENAANANIEKKFHCITPAPGNEDLASINYQEFLNGQVVLDSMIKKMNCYSNIEKKIPKELSTETAIQTLEIMSKCFENAYEKFLESKENENVIGIFNHCIEQIHKNTNMDWQEIITTYGIRFKGLIQKIKEGGKLKLLALPRKPNAKPEYR